jgi:hypothetical protein
MEAAIELVRSGAVIAAANSVDLPGVSEVAS